jgi:thiol-disulfide isomerase/thioredoxin
MKFQLKGPFVTAAMLFVLCTAVAVVKPAGADPIADANIFMFQKPQTVADLVLANNQGRNVSLKDYKGRVVLLHFWSINCPACRMEEPLLHDLKKSFGPAGLEILGVNLVDPPEQAVWHASNKKFPFPVLVGSGWGVSPEERESGHSSDFLRSQWHEGGDPGSSGSAHHIHYRL